MRIALSQAPAERSCITLDGTDSDYQVELVTITGNTIDGTTGSDEGIDIKDYSRNCVIADNIFTNAAGWDNGPVYWGSNYSNIVCQGNTGYIAPGEHREASGVLTAGNANAFAFAWQNPEAQPIWAQVMVEITTAGGTAGSLLDVGSAADGTTHSDDLIDGADLNATNLLTTSAWVKLDENGGTTPYITGQILVENAASLVGKYYVRYFGV